MTTPVTTPIAPVTTPTDLTCDTSVLVPALVSWHPAHDQCRRALDPVRVVPAHVLVECFSVLTRLPAPHRIAPGAASALMALLPFEAVALPGVDVMALVTSLGALGVRGGAAYDALVGATARHHDLSLLTRDRRARATYDAVGVAHCLV